MATATQQPEPVAPTAAPAQDVKHVQAVSLAKACVVFFVVSAIAIGLGVGLGRSGDVGTSRSTGVSTPSGPMASPSSMPSASSASTTSATASPTGTASISASTIITSLTGAVTTLAGSGVNGRADGVGTAALFSAPRGITTDASGNAYIVDRGNHAIRRVVISTGAVTTFAGGSAPGRADGVGTAATFNNPAGITFDGAGNLFVSETTTNLIRRIVIATATVSTLAGSGTAGSTDGVGTAASFSFPWGITSDGAGTLYVAEATTNIIRRIVVATATVTTLAGSVNSGFLDATGTSAMFSNPSGIFFSAGSVYVADTGNNRIRRIVVATGVVTSVAGGGSVGGIAPGSANGVGFNARFDTPYGISGDSAGNLYVADSGNQRIRQIELATSTVTTLTGSSAGFTDGTGTNAQLSSPFGIAASGNKLYVTDSSNNRIRVVA